MRPCSFPTPSSGTFLSMCSSLAALCDGRFCESTLSALPVALCGLTVHALNLGPEVMGTFSHTVSANVVPTKVPVLGAFNSHYGWHLTIARRLCFDQLSQRRQLTARCCPMRHLQRPLCTFTFFFYLRQSSPIAIISCSYRSIGDGPGYERTTSISLWVNITVVLDLWR